MATKILYVEDNPLNMRLVKKILIDLGFDMLEAVDGRSGIELAVVHTPDLILLDINLPDIDGLEITRQLKQHATTRRIPIIALTANAMYGDKERCLDAGCDGYIAKPVAKLELKNVLHHFLAHSGMTSTARTY